MTPKPISPAESAPLRVVVVTLDNHLAGIAARAQTSLREIFPGLTVRLHAASDWANDPAALARCRMDIAEGDIVIATMLFLEDHIRAVLPALEARRDACDAMIGAMSAAEIIRLTRLGKLRFDAADKGPLALLKRLRGSKTGGSSGAGQMSMLRRLPKLLKHVPGPAQDLRAYLLTLQCWLSASHENFATMIHRLVARYAAGPRRPPRGAPSPGEPAIYPEIGLYHPRLRGRFTESLAELPGPAEPKGTIGLVLLRSYALAGDSAHYDGVIEALEQRGLRVIPAFASGLDARPAIDRYFYDAGAPRIDALVSLTGFSLVGGPAFSDAQAAEDALSRLDRPYIAAHPLEFQSLERWGASKTGLTPIEATMMVALPELDGAVGSTPFGGRADGGGACLGCERKCTFDVGAEARAMRACPDRAAALADRTLRLVQLRRTPPGERRLGIVLFNFPPNAGAVGSAAFLAVFESLFNLLHALRAEGYDVDAPKDVEALRRAIIEGNAAAFGADANVAARVPLDQHVRRERWLADIEEAWGAAPGRKQADSRGLQILGARFGNVFVGVQPASGVEGDPMRLLMQGGAAPTHAFAAFYRWMREDFGAHALLHFGTHGALEFMPGKQVGLSGACWPERLAGDLPNVYLYAANNPSEGAIAKRRSAATLVSHLTPPLANAGLHRSLADLKGVISRWRDTPAANPDAAFLWELILDQARAIDLPVPTHPDEIEGLARALREIETSLIPDGLHVVGAPPDVDQRARLLAAAAHAMPEGEISTTLAAALACGEHPEALARKEPARGAQFARLAEMNRLLSRDAEIPALLHALSGGYTRPAPGGDLVRTPEILPTGRNLHGFDPFRIPSAYALKDGARQADRLLARHLEDHARLPETVAMVLWGSDNLKAEGAPLAQALALMGARPRLDSYGRVCGAELIDLEALGRPRIDVVATLSGIFRDLLPLQTRLLAEAALLAASAEEPPELNFVRKHALEDIAAGRAHDLASASLRVFSNAEGAYGANVNQLIDAGCWQEEDELAAAFERRKCFAYGVDGKPLENAQALTTQFARVDVAYQNLESVELGITTIDHYVDSLGGVSKAVKRAKGEDAAIYIGDQTQGEGKVRSLAEQVALESRTRTLNPRWYEGMLRHGYEGVRQIEAQVTNTLGWSATTGQVAPWIYQRVTETYLLDAELRDRLAALNPKACARVAERLIEASERSYWTPDPATLAALKAASEALEDRLEGVAA